MKRILFLFFFLPLVFSSKAANIAYNNQTLLISPTNLHIAAANIVAAEVFPTAPTAIKQLFGTKTRLVFDGDSLTSSNDSYRFWLTNKLHGAGLPFTSHNVAVSGQVIPTMVANYSANVSPFKPASGTNAILFAWAGINDIFFNTNGPITIQNTLSNYWTLAKTDGFTLVAFTISSRSDFPANTNEFERAQINNWIRSQPYWDYLVDVDSLFPYWSSDTYILNGTDFIHFNTNSTRIISDLALASIFRPTATYIAPNNLIPKFQGTNYFGSGGESAPSIAFAADRTTGLSRPSSSFLGVSLGGTGFLVWGGGQQRMSSGNTLAWASGSGFTTGADTGLSRNAAGVVEINNGNAGERRDLVARTSTVTNENVTGVFRVGVANQASITNILSGSAALNFASQSLGGSEDLAITVTGAAEGDPVSLGYESAAATGIIGSYSAWASNGVVFVRFIATAATQNPPSATFKVVVTKF